MVLASRSPPFFTPPSKIGGYFSSFVIVYRRIVRTPLSVPSMKQGARRLTRFQGGEYATTRRRPQLLLPRGGVIAVFGHNRHGIEPAPERSRRTTWKEFLNRHWD